MGRDIEYDYWSCDLLCAASSSELYRINLEQVFSLISLVTHFLLAVQYRMHIFVCVIIDGKIGREEILDA